MYSGTWRPLSLSLAVLGVLVVLANGDLGLDVTVPNLKRDVVASIGEGTVPLVKANGTIKGDTALDTSGVIGGLVDVIGKIVPPLNVFLGQMLVSTTSGESAGRGIFDELTGMADSSKASLDEAAAIAANLATLIKPSVNMQLTDNVQKIGDSIDSVRTQLSTLSGLVDQVRNSVEPITSDNVTTIITKEAVTELTTALKSITTSVKNLADVSNTIVRNVNTNLALQKAVSNAHVTASRTADVLFVAGFNRSYDDVINNIKNLAKTYSANVRQAYGPVQRQVAEESVAAINNYLDSVDQSATSFSDRATETLTQFKEDIAQLLNEQRDAIATTLSDAAKTMTQDALKSDSAAAARCVQASTNQLTLAPPVNRLTPCIQGEAANAFPMTQLIRALLEQSKTSASSNANSARTCPRMGTTCSDSYFSAYSDLALQTDAQLALTNNVVATEARAITNRIRTCVVATVADINDNAQQILTNFNGCLTTGQ